MRPEIRPPKAASLIHIMNSSNGARARGYKKSIIGHNFWPINSQKRSGASVCTRRLQIHASCHHRARPYLCLLFLVFIINFGNLNFRTQKRLPLTTGLFGLALHIVAMTILIVSKLFGIAILLIKAPYYLPICMTLEFLIVLGMDCIVHRTINSK